MEDLRADFNSSKDFVSCLHTLHTRGFHAGKALLSDYWKEESDIRQKALHDIILKIAPDAYEIQAEEEEEDVSHYSGVTPDRPPLEKEKIPISELSRSTQLIHSASKPPDFMNVYLNNTAFMNASGTCPQDYRDAITFAKPSTEFGPELLVGKVLRFYCPVDNQYHIGRIIDWRSARLHNDHDNANTNQDDKDLYYGNYEISNSEFLLHFPPGLNGRKTPLQTWLLLEEHSIAIAAHPIFAMQEDGKNIYDWHPAQLILRSTIELLPIEQYLSQKGDWALVIFHGGDSNHLYCDLNLHAVDFFSHVFQWYRQRRHYQLERQHGTWKSVYESRREVARKGLELVKIELEEERRVYEWHKFMSWDCRHEKCHSMKSEYGLPPLEIKGVEEEEEHENENGEDNTNNNGEDTNHNGTKHKTTKEKKKHNNQQQNIQKNDRPNLCPNIQFGLDRQWICDQFPEKTFYLDTIASFSCSKTNKTMAKKIALFKKQKM